MCQTRLTVDEKGQEVQLHTDITLDEDNKGRNTKGPTPSKFSSYSSSLLSQKQYHGLVVKNSILMLMIVETLIHFPGEL